jgi:hypothetical protein
LKVYIHPNPSNENTTLLISKIEDQLNFVVYSYDGKLIDHGEMNERKTLLKTKDYSNGLYLIHVFKDKNLIEVFKFLKN